MTSRILLNRGVATLVLASTGVVAASASWGADEAPVPSLPEVIVTAQKRAENIQDVPISVIALSAQELKDSGVTDIKNLTVLTGAAVHRKRFAKSENGEPEAKGVELHQGPDRRRRRPGVGGLKEAGQRDGRAHERVGGDAQHQKGQKQ